METELTCDSVLNQIGLGFSEAVSAIIELGPEASIFAILTLAKRVAELSGLVGKGDPSGPLAQTVPPNARQLPRAGARSPAPGLDTPVPVGKHPSQIIPCSTASSAVQIAPGACRDPIQVVSGSSRISGLIPNCRSPGM
jgi:hypothetical protein